MNHTISKIKVYTTNNYKVFKNVNGNRGLNKNKIDRIIKEIESGNDILDEVPILVTEKKTHLEVKDGQHRLQIAERLGRNVNYIIHKSDMSLYNLAKVNSNVEKWTGEDFINCYSAAGNENYITLGKFHKKYKIAIGTCLGMLTYGAARHEGGSHILTSNFEQGVFEIKKYKEAVQLAEICKSFSAFTGWNSRGFVLAISKIIQANQCDFDILLKKYNRDHSKLTNQANWKGYVNNLELIYNIDNSKRRTII